MLKSNLIRIVCITSVTVVFSLAMSLFVMFCLDRYFNIEVPLFSSLNGSGEESVSEEESALEYDGYNGTVNMPETDLLGEKYFTITSSDTGYIYLKNYNYGVYNGKGWDRANEYKEFINSKYSAAYISGAVMQENRMISDTLAVHSYVDLYAFPTYLVPTDEEGRVQSSDVYSNGKADEDYNVAYFSDIDWRRLDPIQNEEFAEFELQYRDYVKFEYTKISSKTSEAMNAVISENGLQKETLAGTIQAVVEYLRANAELDIVPNQDLEKESDVAVAFLTKYKSGNINHFATAATLLFRSMNIPARFTEGFFSICVMDTEAEISEINKYYWVEVYVDGIGWICVDVMRYDLGDDGSDNGDIGIPEDVDLESVIFTALATSTERIYLKAESRGNYNGKTWGDAPEYDDFINGKYSATYMPGLQLINDRNAKLNSLTIVPVAEHAKNQFLLPYYTCVPGDELFLQDSDTVVGGDSRKPYTQSYYSIPSYYGGSGILAQDPAFEGEYRKYVYDNYLYVDDETAAYMEKLIEENALDAFSKDNLMSQISFVADFIENSAVYSYNYDKNLDNEPNIAIAFLETYKKGICQHYATAATLLFRSLGIPARYTVGYVANAEAGVLVDVKAKNAHAWVEVYIDGFGWQYVEVTGGGESLFYIELYPQDKMTITNDLEEVYYPDQILTEGFESFKKKGYTLADVVVSGASGAGEFKTYVTSYKILDPDGNDVTALFDVDTSKFGTLTIIGHILLKPEDSTHIYDGEIKYPEDVYGVGYLEACGYELRDVEFSGETEAGHHKSKITDCKIFKGDKDVTANFDIDLSQEAKLDILYGEITLQPKKTTRIYSGKPQGPEGVDGFDDFEKKNFRIECEFTEFTNIGKYISDIEDGYVIYNDKNEDVTDLFIVDRKSEKFMIKSGEIKIALSGEAKPGERYEYKYAVGNYYTLETELQGFEDYRAAGYDIIYQVSSADCPAYIKNARVETYTVYYAGLMVQRYTSTVNAEGEVEEYYEIFDSQGELSALDYKYNSEIMLFDINIDQCYGEIFVYYTEFVFESDNLIKEYDGKPHSLTESNIKIDATTLEDLAAYEISYRIYDMASVLNVGTAVEARFKVEFTDKDGNDCSELIKWAESNEYGMLELYQKPITISLNDVVITKKNVMRPPANEKDPVTGEEYDYALLANGQLKYYTQNDQEGQVKRFEYNSDNPSYSDDGTQYLVEGHYITYVRIEGSCEADISLKRDEEFAKVVEIRIMKIVDGVEVEDVTGNYTLIAPFCTLDVNSN